MTDFKTIVYGAHDGVATIELARPEKRNAINDRMFQELGDAAEMAGDDPSIRVVIVKGRGPSFSAGIDLNLLTQMAGVRGARFKTFLHKAQRPARTLALMEKPTLAAVHGHALGAGFQLALACDLRIVAEDVQFAMLELRYGLVPDLGGNKPLASLVGVARAKEIVWTGRTLGAEEAERIGLANRVVPNDTFEKEAEAFARELASSPPIPVSLTKTLYTRIEETPFETVLEREGQAQAACLESEDHQEAIAAFLEKRPPRFTGR
jgi:enoyl-CoA hydratase/carnithine racemase